ncbi:hypothetical protein LEN26_001365 [Aphanomyces euteiches]|nr:hypothetical protein AeMF1_016324 [Aphanomyces euteiches]KAH9161521.1 hypothetical protein LEN26_001365 [Aphanomyces euteiches]KAH9186076.1 hypothetical protein AeNC1_011949 [Aphanomyces euteiches]
MKASHNQREFVKKSVLIAARENKDWKLVAKTLGVREKTAAHWICLARKQNDWSPQQQLWGGSRYQKVQEEHVQRLLDALSYTPDLTLESMASILATEYGVFVTTKTISQHLDGRMYTLKKMHYEPEKMNLPEKKLARREFLLRLWQLQGDGKLIFYLDETNYNTWCSREY